MPPGTRGVVTVGGTTDSAGASQVLSRLMTSKFPLVVVLAELAAQLKKKSLKFNLAWAPRDQNEEADDLTNEEFGRFSLRHQMKVKAEDFKWEVPDEYMKAPAEIHARVVVLRKEPSIPEVPRKGKRRPLREREPWE